MDETEIRSIVAQINQVAAQNNLLGPVGQPGDAYNQIAVLVSRLLEGALVNLARIAGNLPSSALRPTATSRP